MSKKRTVWIPALIAAVIAALLAGYYFYNSWSNGGGMHPGEGGGPPGGMKGHPPGGEQGYGELFKTFGTLSVFLGAAGFCWYWFKKKLKSPSLIVRKIGRLLHALHKPLGWAALLLIAAHGIYFLVTKLQDHKIYSGLAAFVILLALAGYGFFINKIRNRWMRLVHRSLALLWVPALLLHAGGSAITAVLITLGIGVLIWILEKWASRNVQPAA
ncbi:hypothetical protein [Paenibacillus pinistramenti]|uniref:hypothetical protein n=1 Tax=Paenibacillus pinistramenti TaxID=1768003 RepID=UPI001109D57B|nr:hypothetical protein [Paenibacillus pinistramenti]